jgi:hypothetical protein
MSQLQDNLSLKLSHVLKPSIYKVSQLQNVQSYYEKNIHNSIKSTYFFFFIMFLFFFNGKSTYFLCLRNPSKNEHSTPTAIDINLGFFSTNNEIKSQKNSQPSIAKHYNYWQIWSHNPGHLVSIQSCCLGCFVIGTFWIVGCLAVWNFCIWDVLYVGLFVAVALCKWDVLQLWHIEILVVL